MKPAQSIAVFWGLLAAGLLGIAIFVGSRNLLHIDAALVSYTFACLFAAFGLGYRYAMWLQRPPTRLYWRRGWQSFLRPGRLRQTVTDFIRRFVGVFLLNRFIWRRSRSRGLTHLLLMWGCLLAAAITFPLVFGWIYFETVPGDLTSYRVFVFGFPTVAFAHASLVGYLLFHGLVWASFLVIAGVLLALHRRLRDHGAAALQDLQEDLMPLFMLFAVSVTGLLLTVSYTWLKGYAYEFLAITHALTVIFTLLWLPFGKFFHIFQRPAQLAVKFYKDVGPGRGTGPLRALPTTVCDDPPRRGSDRGRATIELPIRMARSSRRTLPARLPGLPAQDARPGAGTSMGRRDRGERSRWPLNHP